MYGDVHVQEYLQQRHKKCMSIQKETHGTVKTDAWEQWTVKPHRPSDTYHIHHHKGHCGKEDIWHNHDHFLDSDVLKFGVSQSGSILMVRGHSEHTHASSRQQTSDPSATADEQSAPSSGPLCPDILSVSICPPQMKIKGNSRAWFISQHWNISQSPCTDGWITSTWRPFPSPADFFYLPAPVVFLRIVKSTHDKLRVPKSELKD